MTHRPIHTWIRETATRLGDRPAIEWRDGSLSYLQLEERSNELAAQLLAENLAQGSPVAILTTRTADMVVSILGVLKAGCAFVPIDVHLPTVRLDLAVATVKPRYWLVDEITAPEAQRHLATGRGKGGVLRVDQLWSQKRAEPVVPPSIEVDPDALAYVYFTSGSTGAPKAIAGRLKAIDHYIKWHIETFGVNEDSRVCHLASFSFDAFLREAFAPLVAGGTFCAPGEGDNVLEGRLVDWLDREKITLMHCTPSVFRSILSQDLHSSQMQSLRHALLVGEPLLPSDVRRWRQVFGDRVELFNLYGPTETTMTKLFHRIRPEDGEAKLIPIGRPMPGAKAIVVDDQGRPCPPGRLGEIYLRTPYRSLGYLGDPERTREVFIPNPFSNRPDDIVYKTGDLGRLRDDGAFELVGRRDQQVKVRGVRIELGPIEDVLLSHPAVTEAAVIDRTDIEGNKFLCAYGVLSEHATVEDLRTYILERLPPPAVPSAFVMLDELPRTLSNKVDRRALPDPGEVSGRLRREYVAPRTPVEEKLCEIYSQLLRTPRVGAQDSFFELGGHSLLVMQLLARIEASFVPVPLFQVLETPTVEGLAMAITRIQLERAADQAEAERLLLQIERLSESALDELLNMEEEEVLEEPRS